MKRNRLLLIGILLFVMGMPGGLLSQVFEHPGILHKESDFARMRQKVAEKAEPWYTTWNNLLGSPEANLGWNPRAVETVIRGGTGDNISLLYRDVAAAYQHALIYKISGDKAHGDKAVQILNAWSLINKAVGGNADRYLASGLNGYQLANAGEMMRGYAGFEFERFKTYMLNVFYYPMNERFVTGNAWGAAHNDAWPTNYRVNWDICNMNAMLAISILCDNRDNFNKTLNYAKTGEGNGNIHRSVNFVHSDIWGQWEESGRDQGHAVGGLSLYGLFCEIAWNQGVDFYGYDDSRYRKGAEYVARYNIMANGAGKYEDLPYTSYTFKQGPLSGGWWNTEAALSGAVRGKYGSSWELIYNHYAHRLNQGDKVQSVKEILQQQGSTIWPSVNIHADTYDTPGGGGLTFCTDSGSCILPWVNMDVLARSISKQPYYGSATLKDSVVTVKGSGLGVKSTLDYFQFVFQRLVDDGFVEAQMTGLDEVNALCQAGLMIRESLEQNSANVYLSLSAAQGAVFNARTVAGGTTANVATNASVNTFPYWLRLSRSGNLFVASVSADRLAWIEVGSQTVQMGHMAFVGLAVSSNAAGAVCTAVFDKAKVVQGNMKPVVKLDSPVQGAITYVANARVAIEGTAYDPEGLFDKVDVYLNGNVVTSLSASPVKYALADVGVGDYTVHLVAYDKNGASQSSDTVSFSVVEPTTVLPWYKFDETKSGYFAYDASESKKNALLLGSPTFAAGKVGNAIVMDGVDDCAKLPNGFIEKLSDFTISSWVYVEVQNTWARFLDFGSGTGSYMYLTPFSGSGKLSFCIQPAGRQAQTVDASIAVPIKGWYYVTVTQTGNVLSLYINGLLKGQNTNFTLHPYDLGAPTANYVGRSQFTADPYFNGKVDDLRFYNYGMTAEEVKAAMADSQTTPVGKVTTKQGLFYPNPATDEITVVDSEGCQLMVYNALGTLVLKQDVLDNAAKVNIGHLSRGVYFVTVKNNYGNTFQDVMLVK